MIAIEAEYLPTPKNGLVSGLSPRLGFEAVEKLDGDGVRYRLEVASAAASTVTMPGWLAIEDPVKDAAAVG